MVIRSPACFIFCSELMVTFFKVHLRRMWGRPFRDAVLRSPTSERFSAGRPASGHSSLTRRIARRGAPSSASSEGLVIRRARPAPLDGPDEVVEGALVLGVIHVARVDYQQRRVVPAVEELAVGPRKLCEILGVELPFEVAAALLDAGEEHFQAGLQVDDEVRPHDARAEMLVDTLVETELVRVEGQRGEDPVLREQVVAHRHRLEEPGLEQLLLLLEAGEQEEELRLERVPGAVLVEARQEGVLLDDLVKAARAVSLAESPGERRLAPPDGSFDHDVAVHGGAEHMRTDVAWSTFAHALRETTTGRIIGPGGFPWRTASRSTIPTPARSSRSAAIFPGTSSKARSRGRREPSGAGRGRGSTSASLSATGSARPSRPLPIASPARSRCRWESRSPRRRARSAPVSAAPAP